MHGAFCDENDMAFKVQNITLSQGVIEEEKGLAMIQVATDGTEVLPVQRLSFVVSVNGAEKKVKTQNQEFSQGSKCSLIVDEKGEVELCYDFFSFAGMRAPLAPHDEILEFFFDGKPLESDFKTQLFSKKMKLFGDKSKQAKFRMQGGTYGAKGEGLIIRRNLVNQMAMGSSVNMWFDMHILVKGENGQFFVSKFREEISLILGYGNDYQALGEKVADTAVGRIVEVTYDPEDKWNLVLGKPLYTEDEGVEGVLVDEPNEVQ
ncbi:MAG: hypothetical protein FWC11_06995 [Firmicutes bacterium]|nr:hypothetical protein [Bacillota bacterium]MCL2256571.1 hypothetical protein [Bacillota bacterium]